MWAGLKEKLGNALETSKERLLSTVGGSGHERDDLNELGAEATPLDLEEWTPLTEKRLKTLLSLLKALRRTRNQLAKLRAEGGGGGGGTSSTTSMRAMEEMEDEEDAASGSATSSTVVALKNQQANLSKRIGEALKVLLPTLQRPCYLLLDLWHLLLTNLDGLHHRDQRYAYEAITALLARREFDLSHLFAEEEEEEEPKDKEKEVNEQLQQVQKEKEEDKDDNTTTNAVTTEDTKVSTITINNEKANGEEDEWKKQPQPPQSNPKQNEHRSLFKSQNQSQKSSQSRFLRRRSNVEQQQQQQNQLRHCSKEDIIIAQRYRVLLFNTQAFVATQLSQLTNASHSVSHPFTLFCARVLAVNFFRLPGVSHSIINAVALSPLRLQQLERALLEQQQSEKQEEEGDDEREEGEQEGSPRKEKVVEEEAEGENGWQNGVLPRQRSSSLPRHALRSSFLSYLFSQSSTQVNAANILSRYPILSCWHLFHSALLSWANDAEDEKLQQAPNGWLGTLGERDKLFFVFLKDWIAHIYSCIPPGKTLEWPAVKGYIPFLLAFVYEMKTRENYHKSLMDCSIALLGTNPDLINAYIEVVFSKTNVYDTFAVNEALAKLDIWFASFKDREEGLPNSFDHHYLCQGFEIILATEHHQTVMKLLTVIYNHADVFRANARRALFGDLLLRKHFFPLFLHWDFNVRNTFHQLLVYKMVRLKRSVLRQEGFRVGELARQKHHQQQLQAQRTQSFTVDPEHNNDAFLYGELEDRLAMLQDQLRGTRHNLYPKELEVYVPAALSEYKRYLSYYFMWESEGNVTAPKLVPLSLLDRAAVRPQRASPPTHKTASSPQTLVSSERKPLIDSAD